MPIDKYIQRDLESAVAHHQAGQFAQAEALYRRVLSQVPENPDALQVVFTQVASPHHTNQFKAHVQVNATDV